MLNSEHGWTPRELGKILRVSPDRIRNWIRSGELPALNLAPSGSAKPQFRILPHHLDEFERRRRVPSPPQPVPRRRRQSNVVDYYPERQDGEA
jgi:hypothetical protein